MLDRIGAAATPEIRAALGDPLLRAHAAVWLHEHDEERDEEAELRPEDRTWLLVDLGAGLLEEADPQDVVAELLPEVPGKAQAEIVAGLWRVGASRRHRPADRAERAPPRSRRRAGRAQGRVQGPLARSGPLGRCAAAAAGPHRLDRRRLLIRIASGVRARPTRRN